jgi:hypothetical protein
LTALTFGQKYNSLLTDKEFEKFIRWEIESSSTKPDIFYGLNDNQINYYSKTISWKNLMVVYKPDNESVFDGLFRDIFSDTVFKEIDKAEIKKQYDEDKKNVTFDFIKNIEIVRWTDKRKKNNPTINYSSPILTSDKRLLLICKDYSLNNGNSTIRGEYYINVYKRTQDGWEFYKSIGGTY